ncbi:MAG: hypothetical protein AAF329_24240 [Cyanobacteria bacterium P01_A01_bin.17]
MDLLLIPLFLTEGVIAYVFIWFIHRRRDRHRWLLKAIAPIILHST